MKTIKIQNSYSNSCKIMAQYAHLEQYVSNALEVVEFKLIRDGEKPEDAATFHPEMAHQIFGENENIFGYTDLKIQIYYSAGPLDVYFNTTYSKKIDDLKLDEMKADNVTKAVSKLLPGGVFFTDIDEFLKVVAKTSPAFKPMGDKKSEFTVSSNGVERTFEIYHCTMHTPGFLKYHEKLEVLVFYFVDAASHIIYDSLWDFFLVFEKYKTATGEERYASCGYTSVYRFYAYPDKSRARLSQMMILPPFQRMGIGSKLIEAVYSHYIDNEKITDITVEEPSDIFQNMRSAVDAKLCRPLKSFAPENLKKGLSKEMLEEAKAKYKINPKQCRVVYEILRLAETNRSNPQEYKEYRLEVKRRLGMYYAKQKRDLKRAEKKGVNIEGAIAMLPTHDQLLSKLQEEYEEVEKNYLGVIKKIKNN